MYLYKNIFLYIEIKIIKTKNLIDNFVKYSYSYFCRNNPNATRIERRNAIKRFLDYTRNDQKNIKNKKEDNKDGLSTSK